MAIKTITIASRQSPMALWQAEFIKASLLKLYPKLNVTILGMTTKGDREKDKPLADIGGKALFVKELQKSLLDKRADIAVHCIKDMSVHPVSGLTLCALCARDDPRDAFISNHYQDISELPEGACIGTSSPRRIALLKAIRPDIQTKMLRGNAGTRLNKLDQGEYDAIILSASGLHRLGLAERICALFDPEHFVPAIGQGGLGIECRAQDEEIQQLLEPLNHTPTQLCIAAERAVNQRLMGDCYTPIGAYAYLDGNHIHLKAIVGNETGTIIKSQFIGAQDNAQLIGIKAADDLIAQGANDLLSN